MTLLDYSQTLKANNCSAKCTNKKQVRTNRKELKSDSNPCFYWVLADFFTVRQIYILRIVAHDPHKKDSATPQPTAATPWGPATAYEGTTKS